MHVEEAAVLEEFEVGEACNGERIEIGDQPDFTGVAYCVGTNNAVIEVEGGRIERLNAARRCVGERVRAEREIVDARRRPGVAAGVGET